MAASKHEVISPGLLASINWNPEVPKELKIGMSEWLESDNDKENSSSSNVFQPAKKCKLTKTLKVSKPKDSGKERFSETVSEEQLAVLSKGFVPTNTSKNTKWAVNAFEAWV